MNDVELAQAVVTDCLEAKIVEHSIEIDNLRAMVSVIQSSERLSQAITMIDADTSKRGITREFRELANMIEFQVGKSSQSINDVVRKIRGLIRE